LLAFLAVVWLAISALRLASGESWPAIMHRPFGFLPWPFRSAEPCSRRRCRPAA